MGKQLIVEPKFILYHGWGVPRKHTLCSNCKKRDICKAYAEDAKKHIVTTCDAYMMGKDE